MALGASNACLGLTALGNCAYDPAAPSIYFNLGAGIAALGFTFAVQQLLKPIYAFRLNVRHISLRELYGLVFLGMLAVIVASILPSFPALHHGPLGYPILWEIAGALLFAVAYGTVALAIIYPVRVRPNSVIQFARASAQLLSSANENDHIDYPHDLDRSLPSLIKIAAFIDHYDKDRMSAFYDFIHRKTLERASYAASFLGILADPHFCGTLVRRTPWLVAWILQGLSKDRLHSRSAEQFVRELARQSILREDSMMSRETDYHGFGTVPLLSDSLFSDHFLIKAYDPLDSFRFMSGEPITPAMLKRFNSAVEKCLTAIIDARDIHHSQTAYSIEDYYKSVFMNASTIQEKETDYQLPFEMHQGLRLIIEMADKLLANAPAHLRTSLYVNDPKVYRHDVLSTLADIVFEALCSISNSFKGIDDSFWTTVIDTFHKTFPQFGEQPDGMKPFQQLLAIKMIDKLQDNMSGFYPAICRVLLACVGPYHHTVEPKNRTAFIILKDAMYHELQKLPRLAETEPDKVGHYLPDNVTYDAEKNNSPTLTEEVRKLLRIWPHLTCSLSRYPLQTYASKTVDMR
jgi:hypothetical protein